MIASTSWGVVIAAHQQMKLVEKSLSSRGIEHFIPLEEKLIVVRGRHVRDFVPVFGNYILMAMCAAWSSLIHERGVAGFITNELGMPSQVPACEVEWIKSACDGNIWRSDKTKPATGEFTYGQRITPKSGPLAYQIGRYDKKTKRGDSAIFTLFGREQCVSFKAGELIAV